MYLRPVRSGGLSGVFMRAMDWLRYIFPFLLALAMRGLKASATCPPEYLDTGQSNANGLLVLEGSVDGTPADLRDGVMYYCSNRANHRCRIACTIGFPTVHSPSYSINGRCYSAGGMGKDLRPIGINTTHNHPTYTVSFPCHAINYRCVINGTVHSQEVRVQPDTAACGTSPPATTSNPPVNSDGNATNGNATIEPPAADDGFTAGGITGIILAGLLIVGLIATFFIFVYKAVVHREGLSSQVNTAFKVMCPCCARDCEHGDDTDLEEQLSDAKQATVDDRGGTELVPGLSLPVDGGEWLQRVKAITHSPKKDPLCDQDN